MRGTDITFWVTLGAAGVSIFMSLLMMNAARDKTHKAKGSTSSETRLATANMFMYSIVVVPFLLYILFAWFLCNRDSAITKAAAA